MNYPAIIIICSAILSFGIFYALLIYWRPFPPGWTWLSVVIGDAMTDTGSVLLLITLLQGLGLADYYLLSLVPVFMHLLTGIPMIIGQIAKHIIQKRQNSNLMENFNA